MSAESDYLYEPRETADPSMPEVARLEASLRPLAANPPPLPALPERPRDAAPRKSTGVTEMTLPPAIPTSSNAGAANRGPLIVGGALVLAAAATLGTLWALRPSPAIPTPAVADPGTTGEQAPAGPALQLTGARGVDVQLVELVVMPRDASTEAAGMADTFAGDTFDGFAPQYFGIFKRFATKDVRTVYVSKSGNVPDARAFPLTLEAGEYAACGMITARDGTAWTSCRTLEVDADGRPSIASLPVRRWSGEDAGTVSPDLKDPFASPGASGSESADPRAGDATPRGRKPRRKKSVASPDLKDPFSGRHRDEGASSPNLEDPFKPKDSSTKTQEPDSDRGVLDPWADDAPSKSDELPVPKKGVSAPDLSDPYQR